MDKEQPTSLAVLQDKIRDLTRERDGLKRQLAFNQEDNASLRTRYEEDLMDTRAQRDDARKHLVEKETEIDVSKRHIAASRDELQRQNKVEVEALKKEFSAERAAWKEVKAAMESEIERLKASGSGIPAAEVEALLRELDRANAENRNLQDRIDTIRVAAMPQGVPSSSRSGPSPRQAKQESHNSMDLDGAQDVKPRTADLTESTGSQPSQKPHTDESAGTKRKHSESSKPSVPTPASDARVIQDMRDVLADRMHAPTAKRQRTDLVREGSSLDHVANTTSASGSRSTPTNEVIRLDLDDSESDLEIEKTPTSATHQGTVQRSAKSQGKQKATDVLPLTPQGLPNPSGSQQGSTVPTSTSALRGAPVTPQKLSTSGTQIVTPSTTASDTGSSYGFRHRNKPRVTQQSPALSEPEVHSGLSTARTPSTKQTSTPLRLPCIKRSPKFAFPASLNARVASYSPVSVSSLPQPTAADEYKGFYPRHFLESVYGCPRIAFIGTADGGGLKKDDRPRRVCFPRLEYNPSLPLRPGYPGTLITNRMEITSNGPWNIWIRASEKPLWLNVGLYECTKSKHPLTADEWKALSLTVRNTWVACFHSHTGQWTCYTSMRARMVLRKKGTKITEQSVKDEMTRPSISALSVQDVHEAMNRGDEHLNVILLKPVGYDDTWKRDMEKRYALFVPGTKYRGGASGKKNKRDTTREDSEEMLGVTSTSRAAESSGSSMILRPKATKNVRPEQDPHIDSCVAISDDDEDNEDAKDDDYVEDEL